LQHNRLLKIPVRLEFCKTRQISHRKKYRAFPSAGYFFAMPWSSPSPVNRFTVFEECGRFFFKTGESPATLED
jgi:hypothetical protein